MRSIDREFVRFIICGAVNTAASYVIYLALLVFVSYLFAYTISYILGIFTSYYLSARFAFRQKLRLSTALQYPAVYLFQYLFGVGLLYILVDWLGVGKRMAPVIVVLLAVPLTFLMSRFVIKRGLATK
jgi:putative flippase GtrA